MSNEAAATAIGQWFRLAFAGCEFAASLAKGGQIVVGGVAQEDLSSLDDFFDAAAGAKKVGIVVFPQLRTPESVARLLAQIALLERWRLSPVAWGKHAQPGVVPLALTFETQGGLRSVAMGLAPIGTMPATRRAPYVAVASWAGGVENPFMKAPTDGSIGFANGPHLAPGRAAHKVMLDGSKKITGDILSNPPEDEEWLRKVAFLLPDSAVAAHLPGFVAS